MNGGIACAWINEIQFLRSTATSLWRPFWRKIACSMAPQAPGPILSRSSDGQCQKNLLKQRVSQKMLKKSPSLSPSWLRLNYLNGHTLATFVHQCLPPHCQSKWRHGPVFSCWNKNLATMDVINKLLFELCEFTMNIHLDHWLLFRSHYFYWEPFGYDLWSNNSATRIVTPYAADCLAVASKGSQSLLLTTGALRMDRKQTPGMREM